MGLETRMTDAPEMQAEERLWGWIKPPRKEDNRPGPLHIRVVTAGMIDSLFNQDGYAEALGYKPILYKAHTVPKPMYRAACLDYTQDGLCKRVKIKWPQGRLDENKKKVYDIALHETDFRLRSILGVWAYGIPCSDEKCAQLMRKHNTSGGFRLIEVSRQIIEQIRACEQINGNASLYDVHIAEQTKGYSVIPSAPTPINIAIQAIVKKVFTDHGPAIAMAMQNTYMNAHRTLTRLKEKELLVDAGGVVLDAVEEEPLYD